MPDSAFEQAAFLAIQQPAYSAIPASLEFETAGEILAFSSPPIFDQSELSIGRGSYGLSSSLLASFGFFGIALWLVGLAVACIGLFSLSLQRRIGGIHSKELADQIISLDLRSAARNVSNNWKVKKEARWFVLMGLGSMTMGLLFWLF